ncbi:MAG: FtsX-like permease family protein, partial [Aureliella sp.]
GYAPDRGGFPESGWIHRRRTAAARKRMVQLQLEYELEKKENAFLQGLEHQNNDYLKSLVDSVGVMAPRDLPLNEVARLDASTIQAADAMGNAPDAADGDATADWEGNDSDFPNQATASETADSDPNLVDTSIEHVASSASDSPLPAPPPEYASSGSSNSFTTSRAASDAASASRSTASPFGGPSVDAVATRPEDQARVFDAEHEQHDGIVLGISIGSTRYRDATSGKVADYYYVQPGDDVRVTFPSAGNSPTAIHKLFTVVDFYESKMSEYDATFAFVPIERLQAARGMAGAVCSIQLRLRDGADLNYVRDSLRAQFPLEMSLQINTWRDLQGALLAAVQMETTILNILLFLIIAVAGFGILATFFMIVVEKTKDIGVLKSLGASGFGIASIFLGYGVLLGAFGAGVGAVAGLVFVAHINSVADLLETITGQEVFDPTVYYFETIPTIVDPWTVAWVIVGAVLIAVMASVLPSIRAARMHPVEALRYE